MPPSPKPLLPPLTLSPFLTILFSLLLPCTPSPIPNCSPSTCGNSTIQIPYPFWLAQNPLSTFCGYPDLMLHCLDNNTILSLPDAGNYTVTAFNISSQTLSLLDTAAIADETCPQPLHNLSIYSNFYNSTLSFTSEDTQLFFYYNCSKTTSLAVPLRCKGGKSSYAVAVNLGVTSTADCEENVVAPVMHASAVGTDRFFYGDVVGVVKLGFQMHWDGGGGDECRRCEGSAGLCGRGPKGFVCFCESGISDKDCDEGKVSDSELFILLRYECATFKVDPLALVCHVFAKMLQSLWYPSSLCCLLLLLPLLLRSSASVPTNPQYVECSDPELLRCGKLNFTYPFRLLESKEYCGYPGYELNCNLDDESTPLTIKFGGEDYAVLKFFYLERVIVVVDSYFMKNECPLRFTNTSFNSTLFSYSRYDSNLTVYVNCNFPNMLPQLPEIPCLNKSYYKVDKGPSTFLDNFQGSCELTAAVAVYDKENFDGTLKGGFGLNWKDSLDWCQECMDSGGRCGYNETQPEDQICFCSDTNRLRSCFNSTKKQNKGLIIGITVAGGLCVAMVCSFCFIRYAREKKKRRSSSTIDRIVSFQPFSKSDPELGCSLHAPIFKYDDLYEATNGFDDSKELGDGGFGAVYKGKLRDGRVVAVKRLYENNYRRVEQFINEVNILSLLRHQNLVSLYGCTSRHSRELLLVYEFVPNGTVADHIHGSRASESFMPWHVRMSIAIETADALNYLHSVEPQIIHRDIKTNNLLLDNNFHVKVADFGISRLFPLDATHVSTAPQGTPGYVDPEYHQCYQLTDKSDVYSFGVVLMEFISSMPAVDITRERNEINLARMAINKIQRQELHEFVDKKLGYESDHNINRMINQVAELAFQCLQSDREMRPSIKDVLEVLIGIENGGRKNESFEDVNATLKEEAQLLKSSPPYSPNSVTIGWVSNGTTPNTSG
ncbi:hypothetical protein IEQ34_022408 [Dendrobium chrysotoxum]|uniref:Protein kinase domain-containing protein n=1 Tax=Dendrobium chrysotoxum TaxID=161865 RepID=A0AAV7FYY4_DENCH|nr:hypothetical protein IEQ34_022408 [Dendrobium chrysotoxum]